MPVFPIAPLTIQAGDTVYGPVKPGAGLNQVLAQLEASQMSGPITIAAQKATAQGQPFVTFGSMTFTATGTNRDGTPNPNLVFQAGLGRTAAGPVLTTNQTLVQFIVSNAGADMPSQGGEIDVT
jgi:hypothetical protein